MKNIFLNQIGYLEKGPKCASVIHKDGGVCGSFQIKRVEGDEIIFEGELSEMMYDAASGMQVRNADFSSLQEAGRYYLEAAGEGSHPFSISKNPYTDVKKAVMKGFYYQRCGMELTKEHAGAYRHPKCHDTMAVLAEAPEIRKEVSGGWHDAGDYGRYSVAAATALGHMLYGYEMFPEGLKDFLNIPESGNGVDDILNECRYEHEWLMKMQSAEGGVHHKVATRYFCNMVMPQDDDAELLLFRESTCATASACAAFAQAARIYRKVDEEFAERLRQAAVKAWGWLEENPVFHEFKNPADVDSGEYGDDSAEDEIFWASCEMYRLTQDDNYRKKAEELMKDIEITVFGWSETGGFGGLTLLLETGFGDDELSVRVKQEFIRKAEEYLAMAAESGFGTAMTNKDYIWGSNMVLLCRTIVLLIANKIEDKQIYIDAALEQINYLLGKNPLGICYITGVGSYSCRFPHHRPSIADGVTNCVPGLVSGGPDSGLHDEYALRHFDAQVPPALCYLDNDQSYSTNEVTIYWNSPAVFVFGFFDNI